MLAGLACPDLAPLLQFVCYNTKLYMQPFSYITYLARILRSARPGAACARSALGIPLIIAPACTLDARTHLMSAGEVPRGNW
ncbi:hypothetical protein A0H81_04946 [Grifola frondosa]|uniref:Uncharacterized protein n=1 Tax=Grifola frondosa TaxID=5627 RepID=A0A1C7MJX3_GRIFR|nr:hypothetical protein A0H81_04946 [Grifola frondosa]